LCIIYFDEGFGDIPDHQQGIRCKSKIPDFERGAEERRLSRIDNTSQEGAIEGNAADGTLMVDQGETFLIAHFKEP